MPRMIHARLDAETERMLRRIGRHMGWSDSQIVREGIKILNSLTPRGRQRVSGLGCCASGIPDLGSNTDHLKGFGR
jgi:hypothetical protein